MKKLFIFALLPIFGLVLFGGSCFKKSTEKIIENRVESKSGGDFDIDIKGDKIEYKYENEKTGESVEFGNAKIPKDWPSDIPLYNKEVIFTTQTPSSMSLNLQSKDDGTVISEWYERKMEKENWELESELKMEKVWSAAYKKDESTLNIMVNAEGDQTAIILGFVKNQK